MKTWEEQCNDSYGVRFKGFVGLCKWVANKSLNLRRDKGCPHPLGEKCNRYGPSIPKIPFLGKISPGSPLRDSDFPCQNKKFI